MLRRYGPLHYEHLLVSDSETESDDDRSDSCCAYLQKRNKKGIYIGRKGFKSKRKQKGEMINGERSGDMKASIGKPDEIIKLAETYQEYMKQIPVPNTRGSAIPFKRWEGLAKSMKQLYEQPLHYLTNVLMKQWDESRIGSEDEDKAMDTIIHPSKAEDTIWFIEEVHRRNTSHHHLAKLWLSDPMYHAFVDPDRMPQS